MFAAGVTSVPFDVIINDDNIIETNESLTLTIAVNSLPRKVTTNITTAQTIMTIIDNDSKCLYTVVENLSGLIIIHYISAYIYVARTEFIAIIWAQ